jgi:hypothetical protein
MKKTQCRSSSLHGKTGERKLADMRLGWGIAALVVLAGCGGSPSDTVIQFEGFTQNAAQLFVVRVTEGGHEKPGTRQSAGIRSDGSVQFQFLLVAETQYHLQYYVDVNDNTRWDGPVDTGEPSWDRAMTLPAPLHNRDTIVLTVGYDTHFTGVPDDFTAP